MVVFHAVGDFIDYVYFVVRRGLIALGSSIGGFAILGFLDSRGVPVPAAAWICWAIVSLIAAPYQLYRHTVAAGVAEARHRRDAEDARDAALTSVAQANADRDAARRESDNAKVALQVVQTLIPVLTAPRVQGNAIIVSVPGVGEYHITPSQPGTDVRIDTPAEDA